MTEPDDTQARLTQLEIKASFTEDLLDQLDQIVIRQQNQIDRLCRELGELRQQANRENRTTPGSSLYELPPHY